MKCYLCKKEDCVKKCKLRKLIEYIIVVKNYGCVPYKARS